MKKKTLIICAVLLNLFAFELFAQNLKPQLYDEYGRINEGEREARLDNFFAQLKNNPEAKGYILAYGKGEDAARHEKTIRNYLQRRNFPAERIGFIGGGERADPLFQLWIVPKGALPPDPEGVISDPVGDICPVLEMIEPEIPVVSGEKMIFTAKVTGFSSTDSVTFSWAVTAGTIISGQGTPSISVDTAGLDGAAVTASVEISGSGFLDVCARFASGTGVVLETPKARLFDEFERGNCEQVLERTDGLFYEIYNNPADQAYIIISGRRRAAASAEREVRNWIRFRKFDASRLTIIRGGGSSNERAKIEMWMVPPGANPPEPDFQAEPEAEKEPEIPTKPYIFSREHFDGIEGCKEELDVEAFAEALKANPKARGNIVIYASNRAFFREWEKELLAELQKNGIARRRLKTFYKRGEDIGGIELWFLP